MSASEQDEPDLTNDDTLEDSYSETAGQGETDEHSFDEEAMMDALPSEADEPVKKTPAKRKRATPAKKAVDGEETAASKKAKKSKGKKAVTAKDYADGHPPEKRGSGDDSDLTAMEELEEKPKKARKPRKPRAPKPEPVYVIPDVETRPPHPTFDGRIGYACLNTILRKKKPTPVFCSRTCRIDTIKKNGMDFLKSLGQQNMKDLAELIQWNEDHHIKFMRLSSEMFPFASHGEYGYTLEYAQEELKIAGDLANKYGHRVTTHPGQFTQLGSPRKQVVDNAFKDLIYHCEMLDRMGIGKEGVMIIHGGGVFGDKPATLERIKENYKRLPENVKMRIVLENDEMCYNVDDLLPLCEELNIPMVLDYHHFNIFPSANATLEELMPRIVATWEKKGIKPKFHLSEERPGAVTVMERRAHSDRCKRLPEPLPAGIDLMIEAKDKEQAVFHLYRIYNYKPTIHLSLRPPAEVETLRTAGRKSSKKKKAKPEDEGEDEGLEDPEAEQVMGENGEMVDKPDPAKELVNMDGAEVSVPRDPIEKPAKKAKTPRKPRAKKEEGVEGQGEADPSSAKKTPAKRKPKAKKGEEQEEAVKAEEVEQQILAEPAEAQPVEDMKMKEVSTSIVQAAPCPNCKPDQTCAEHK